MTIVKSRPATKEEIVRCHKPALFDKLQAAKIDLEYIKLQRSYNSFYMNYAQLAAGCVTE